jgi:polygalacturonase
MYCSDFSMIGITVLNPPFWAMHPYVCDNLLFEDITYSAPVNSPNTDGIDPDSCSNVVIRNFTTLGCGDDAIAIKSGKNEEGRAFATPSKNILIEGGSIGPSSGIDIGSEMSGGVYNVMVRNVKFKGALFAGRIKSGRGRGGKLLFDVVRRLPHIRLQCIVFKIWLLFIC